jgi:hypothetical protein
MKDNLHLMQALSVFVLGDNMQTRDISLNHDEAHLWRGKKTVRHELQITRFGFKLWLSE